MKFTIRIRTLLMLFLLVLVTNLYSLNQAQRVRLLGLWIEGNKTVDSNTIRSQSGLMVGTDISSEDIQYAMKALWEMNTFSDIKINADREVANGIFLSIVVQEYPRLEKIELEGNKVIKSKTISKELDFYKGQIITRLNISKAEKKLKELYREKGYQLAEIKSSSRESETSERIILRFSLIEGNKINLKKINFIGNTHISDRKLRAQMKTLKEYRWWSRFWYNLNYSKEALEEDLQKVAQHYRNEGYRDIEIVRDSTYYDKLNNNMFIDVEIKEGLIYYFGAIEFRGNYFFPDDKLHDYVDFKPGDKFNEELFINGKDSISSVYWDAGYIMTDVQLHETFSKERKINVAYTINENLKQTFVNEIIIKGNTKTKDWVIRKELLTRPGYIFKRDAFRQSISNIGSLGLFKDVNTSNYFIGDDINIVINLEEKSSSHLNMSAGWSELDGMIAEFGITEKNWLGNGQNIGLTLGFGESRKSQEIYFSDKWLFHKPISYEIKLYNIEKNRNRRSFRRTSRGGTINLDHKVPWLDDYFRFNYQLRIDKTNIFDFSDKLKRINPNGVTTEDWPLFTTSLTHEITRNRLDNDYFPTTGTKFTFSNELAFGLFSFLEKDSERPVRFHKHLVQASLYTPITKSTVLQTAFATGYVNEYGKNSTIPYFDLFFIGGFESVRGYREPFHIKNKAPIGGRVMMRMGFELRQKILEKPISYILAFSEAGNRWDSFSDSKIILNDMFRSVGIGWRVRVDRIMVGFDHAYGFQYPDKSGETLGGEIRHHLILGTQL